MEISNSEYHLRVIDHMGDLKANLINHFADQQIIAPSSTKKLVALKKESVRDLIHFLQSEGVDGCRHLE